MSATGPRGWRRLALLPAALYRAAVSVRNSAYDRPGAAIRVGVPVISVGNLTVGGTGKTPMTAWVCERLVEMGHRPAIVSRGYGGGAGAGPVIVSRGGPPRVGPEVAGDEPYLLARALPDVRVVVGSNRVAGAREAISIGADVVVLDDGFQHRRIARDVDLVLLDRTDPFGGDALLPAGRLREPPGSLARADVVVVTRTSAGDAIDTIAGRVRALAPEVPVVRAGHRGDGFVDRAGRPVEAPPRAVAFCGIGNPARFTDDLVAAGVEIVARHVFRDHHAYRRDDVAAIVADAGRLGAIPVTTEKDLARLERTDAPEFPDAIALRIATAVHDPGPLDDAIRRALGRR